MAEAPSLGLAVRRQVAFAATVTRPVRTLSGSSELPPFLMLRESGSATAFVGTPPLCLLATCRPRASPSLGLSARS
jgi:hypothetical protein